MHIDSIVADPIQRSFVAYVVWTIFNASKDQMKVRILFFSIDIAEHVERWITAKFGPDPVDPSVIPALG